MRAIFWLLSPSRIRPLVSGCLLLASFSAHSAVLISIEEALSILQNAGYRLLYSSDAVDLERRFYVANRSPEQIRQALPDYGLTLEPNGDIWILVPGERNAVSLAIVSSAGGYLTEVGVEVNGMLEWLQLEDGGILALPYPRGTQVRLRAGGHQIKSLTLNDDAIEVSLISVPEMEQVIVTGSRHLFPIELDTGSSQSLSGDEMRSIPALAGDSLRVANRLPGVSSVGISAKPRIRGGLQDEVLILVDGTELIDPFHLSDFQAPISSISDRTVSQLDMYTGGFPARYGNRISGVMDITTEAAEPAENRTELGLSVVSAQINTRGATENGKTSWLASARYGLIDLIATQGPDRTVEPTFRDTYARLDHQLTENARLFAGAMQAVDDVRLKIGDEDASSKITTNYLWTRVDLNHNDNLKSTNVLSLAESERNNDQTKPFDADDSTGFLDFNLDYDRYSWRSNFSLASDRQVMEFGLQLEYSEAEYLSTALIDRGDLPLVVAESAPGEHNIDLTLDGFSGGLYWSTEYLLGDKWRLTPGLRWDFQEYYPDGSRSHWSPRLGIGYQPTPEWEIRFDAGRFYQASALNEIDVGDAFTELQEPQRAVQYIGSVDWQPTDTWSVSVDAYRKDYSNPKTRFENIFNPFVLVPEVSVDRVRVDPTESLVEGYDLDIRNDFSDTGSVIFRYSHMDAKDRINNTWVPRRWSQRNTLNLINTWEWESVRFAAAVTWHSGWRTSSPPESVELGDTLALEHLLNNQELPDYFSLDISISKTWQIGNSVLTAYADIANLTNRDNSAGIDWDVSEEDTEVVFESDQEFLVGIAPTIGIWLSF